MHNLMIFFWSLCVCVFPVIITFAACITLKMSCDVLLSFTHFHLHQIYFLSNLDLFTNWSVYLQVTYVASSLTFHSMLRALKITNNKQRRQIVG